MSRDAIDQANLYAYVDNDPVNYIDPAGLRLEFIGSPTRQQREDFQNLISACASDSSVRINPKTGVTSFSFKGNGTHPRSEMASIISDMIGNKTYNVRLSLLASRDVQFGAAVGQPPENRPGQVIGDKTTHRIDTADFLSAIKADSQWGKAFACAVLYHELWEARGMASCKDKNLNTDQKRYDYYHSLATAEEINYNKPLGVVRKEHYASGAAGQLIDYGPFRVDVQPGQPVDITITDGWFKP